MESIKLPDPDKSTPLSQLLLKRRSVRKYSRGEIDLKELSQILWSAYGLINEERRVVPSAGATYPVEVFIFASRVSGVKPGIYKYSEYEHSLIPLKKGDYSRELAKACLDQSWVKNAPLNIVIVARYRKTTDWYGERGFRYIYMEAGHIGQNIYLSATELGLGTVAIGAFKDEEVARLIGLGEEYIVLYVFPIGRTT
jgi:SagB-type dehydrogenase family enzyme